MVAGPQFHRDRESVITSHDAPGTQAIYSAEWLSRDK